MGDHRARRGAAPGLSGHCGDAQVAATSNRAQNTRSSGRLALRLASTSPRRRLLLPLLGYPVKPVDVEADEQPWQGEAPQDTALRLAEAKATAAGHPGTSEVVVGADTVVVLERRQLGKPRDADEAHDMLAELRGRRHEVISGVALLGVNGRHCGAVTTSVWMRDYSEAEIERYVGSERPLDKAGAYAIQDRDFGPVERIDGCYLNVVGLPLCEVGRGLLLLGWPLVDERYEPPCRLCRLGQRVL